MTEDQRYLREEYTARVNRVIDYIEANIDQPLNLESLAGVASFSPYHFHRIFGAMVGETLNHFIQRIRVEKAAVMLLVNPKKSITEIAFDCGFSGSAAFARSFKEHFGMSASQWRSSGNLDESKNRKTESKESEGLSKGWKDIRFSSEYIGDLTTTQKWRVAMKKGESRLEAEVEVREMPEMHVAYVRHIGPYQGDVELFERQWGKLMKWAGPRGLLRFPETKCLSVYHDSPEITEEEKLRMDVCITVEEDTQVEGEVGKMTIAGGRYAVARFEVDPDQYGDAWNAVFGGWLPDSGYQPADGPSFELYHGDAKDHPEGKHVFDICVPVEPL